MVKDDSHTVSPSLEMMCEEREVEREREKGDLTQRKTI